MAVTFSDYRSFQAPPGFRDEFIHGKIILSPSPNRKHADLCSALYDLLKVAIHTEYVVRLDTTHHLGEKEGPRPDVFVISRARWIAADDADGLPEGSPELAIEVLSPSNSDWEMRTKREVYFTDSRCLQVWEVDAESMTVSCYERASTLVYRTPGQIPIPAQLGKGQVDVQSVFAGIVS